MTSIGIGVIGMGWMGQTHSRSYTLIGTAFSTPASSRAW